MNFSISSPWAITSGSRFILARTQTAAAFLQTSGSVQGRFLGFEERLEPRKSVTVLKGVIAWGQRRRGYAIALAANATMGNLGLRVSGDERRQIDFPIKAGFDASRLPIEKIGLFERRSQTMPRG